MTTRCLVAIAAAIMTTMVVLPADARAKKAKRPDAQKRYEVQTPSLDGRLRIRNVSIRRIGRALRPLLPLTPATGFCERRPHSRGAKLREEEPSNKGPASP